MLKRDWSIICKKWYKNRKNLLMVDIKEKDKRAGTENVAGIVGIGKACEIAKRNMETHIKIY